MKQHIVGIECEMLFCHEPAVAKIISSTNRNGFFVCTEHNRPGITQKRQREKVAS